MVRILITGSAGGLGLNAARELMHRDHEVVLHAREESRFADLVEVRRRLQRP